MAMFGVFLLLAWPLLAPGDVNGGSSSVSGRAREGPSPAKARPTRSPRAGNPIWFLVPGIVVLSVLAPVAAVARRRRWLDSGGASDTPRELGKGPGVTVADLEREPDPRRAVLRAYAGLEDSLDQVGIVRGGGETAMEFLQRVISRLPRVSSAASALTARFEEACFSDHEISRVARAEAIAALRTIRVETEGTS